MAEKMDEHEAMKCAMRDVLDERSRMPSEEHRSHHEWVALQIEKQKTKRAFWEAMLAKSLPAMIVSLLATCAGLLWHWLTNHITLR